MSRWPLLTQLKNHRLLLLILLIHLTLTTAYSILTPLGEAPDEPAHLQYAQFIARQGHLPETLEERSAAGYRANWPPLYHALIAQPIRWVGDAQPTRLKSVGDTPRRLIPTNGQTIASFIHTVEEKWPWRGVVLSWHLSRFISVGLTALAVLITYLIAWHLTQNRVIASSAAALHAFIPQFLFVGSVVSDDTLLIPLSGLVMLALIIFYQRGTLLQSSPALVVGLLLGLTTVAKYNALPLWGIVAIWGILSREQFSWLRYGRYLGLVSLGAAITGGWWFIFIWRNFNQVAEQGWFRGSFTALIASTSDATLRGIAAGQSVNLENIAIFEWGWTLFRSFWGSFGGGGTIDFPRWVYVICLGLTLIALFGLIQSFRKHQRGAYPFSLFLLTPLFFLPLPLLRFIVSGSVPETAQGRHLFPALPAITLALTWGYSQLRKNGDAQHQTSNRLIWVMPAFLLVASLFALPLIQTSYPPLIPLYVTSPLNSVEQASTVQINEEILLLDAKVTSQPEDTFEVNLTWQAIKIPSQDYLIHLIVQDSKEEEIGNWVGYPLGGRYPTRAWDETDILQHTVQIPVASKAGDGRITLQLLDVFQQPASETVVLAKSLELPASSNTPLLPNELRSDELPDRDPFTYRSTLSFRLPTGSSIPDLRAPDGTRYPPVLVAGTIQATIIHFIVDANWPSGAYRLAFGSETLPPEISAIQTRAYNIENRPRQFTVPEMSFPVEANFFDTATLLGYDLPQQRVQPGESFPVTLHWQARRTIGQDLTVFNHLIDQNFVQYGGADRIPLKYYTALLWVPQEIISDDYVVPVAQNAPNGVYWLDVGLYPSKQADQSLPLVQDGQILDRNSVPIGPIKVGGPPDGVTVQSAQPQYPLDKRFGDQITLLGFDLMDTDSRPLSLETQSSIPSSHLENAHLTLYWQSERQPEANYTVFLHLLDDQGNVVRQFDGPPANNLYPTALWDVGEIIQDEHILSDIPSGQIKLVGGLYRPDTGARLLINGGSESAAVLFEFEVQ